MRGRDRPAAGFVTFGVLRVDGPGTAAELVGILTEEVTRWVRHTEGFVSARVHVSLDGGTVVNRGQWTSEEDYHSSFRSRPADGVLPTIAGRPGVLAATVFTGTPAPGIEGPQAAEEPGVVAVATRHLSGHESAVEVTGLLARSGEWKRHHPGFISATPYLSQDGTTFINYPMWVNEFAYCSWMRDPRITEGQEEIARLEVAPPEYLLCTVAAEVEAPAPQARPGAAVENGKEPGSRRAGPQGGGES